MNKDIRTLKRSTHTAYGHLILAGTYVEVLEKGELMKVRTMLSGSRCIFYTDVSNLVRGC